MIFLAESATETMSSSNVVDIREKTRYKDKVGQFSEPDRNRQKPL